MESYESLPQSEDQVKFIKHKSQVCKDQTIQDPSESQSCPHFGFKPKNIKHSVRTKIKKK